MDLAAGSHLHLLDLRSRGVSQHTLRVYALVESRYLEWLRRGERGTFLANLSPDLVRQFLAELAEQSDLRLGREGTLGPTALHQHAKTLKTWAAYLTAQEKLYRDDPLKGLRLPRIPKKEPPRFTLPDVKRMVDLCAQTREPLRNAAILRLLLDTGLRVSELCALRVEDVQLGSAKHLGRAEVKVGKGGQNRWVYFGLKTSQTLARYLTVERAERDRAPWLFLGQRGGPITRAVVDYQIRTLAARAGVAGVRTSPHVLRHTFATEYLKANPGQLSQVQAMLGHHSLEMVQHYARLAQSDVEASYRSPVDGLR